MGLLHSFITQSWPPKTKFTVEDIPDLTDKIALITGGNTGIGYHTAKVVNPTGAKRMKKQADFLCLGDPSS